MSSINPSLLSNDDWQSAAKQHLAAVKGYTDPFRKRRGIGKSHPILDFLFTYYSYSSGRLEQWHPSLGQHLSLDGKTLPKPFLEQHYSIAHGVGYLDVSKLTEQRRASIKWMITLLENTQNHTAIYGCYGMHEWAMVYKGVDVRHSESAPLRLGQNATDAFVESRPILCSHHDAFRFFTPEARKFNKIQPAMDTREKLEQPACVHANMDLYKWAYKCMPWVGSDFLLKTFQLALEMRELDMRAAPYDLSEWNCIPIKVETPDGRKEYEQIQRRLAVKAKPIRIELIQILKNLIGDYSA